jgi:SAM-dependent methyltransferase
VSAPEPPQDIGATALARARGLTREAAASVLARFYDLDVRDVSYDAELYLELAQQADGAVLELGVGSGRLAIPLALAGHQVTGIDNDAAMLARARRAWNATRGPIARGRLRLVEQDLSAFQSPDRFAMAFMAVNTFLLAEDDSARLAVLGVMRGHLVPGGTAVVEVSTPDEAELATYDGRLQLEWLRADPETGDRVTKLMSARHDPDAKSVTLTQIFEWTPWQGGPVSQVSRTDRLYLLSPEHLGRLAMRAGFGSVDLRGDHLLTPHGPGSHRVILIARLV